MPNKHMFMVIFRKNGCHQHYGDKPDDHFVTIHQAFVFADDEADAKRQAQEISESVFYYTPESFEVAPAGVPIEIGNVRY